MTLIKCYTLFDISSSGIFNRKPPLDLDAEKLKQWHINRNKQVNFDTILQVISLRGQPENISQISSQVINFKEFNNFGFMYDDEEDQNCYSFEFSVNHKGVFDDGVSNLGALYYDCIGVPMIKMESNFANLSSFLDVTPELRNIYFEVISNE